MMSLRRRVVSASLALVILLGTYTPAYAVIDCDKAPDAPICSGEPRPKPKPIPRPPAPAPITDYPAAITLLLQRRDLVEQTVDTVWREFGKGVAAQKIKEELNGKRVGKGLRIKDVNVNLRDITVKEVIPGPAPNQVSVRLVIPRNNTKFDVAVDVLPDPTFRVYYTLTTNLTLAVDNSSQPIKVNQLNVQVSDADLDAASITGSIFKAVADFFTLGGFSRGIASRINAQDRDLTDQLSGSIKSAVDRIRQQLGV